MPPAEMACRLSACRTIHTESWACLSIIGVRPGKAWRLRAFCDIRRELRGDLARSRAWVKIRVTGTGECHAAILCREV